LIGDPLSPTPPGEKQVDLGKGRGEASYSMKTYIALLRGINVLGRNSLPMKELVTLLEHAGASAIKTYIQSGNAVFQINARQVIRLPGWLTNEIEARYGFSPQVLILGLQAIESAIAQNPFSEAEGDPTRLHLGFLAATPKRIDMPKLDALRKPSERFHLGDHVIYLHTPDGFGKSKLPAGAEKLLGVPVTYRNWRTVCKIRELAGE
jgi:uncharacterized protein (DUF1697 family)